MFDIEFFLLPQRRVEQLQQGVRKAQVAEAEAGGVPGERDPALVVDVAADGRDPGRGHLVHEALGPSLVEAVDRLPAVLASPQLHRLHVLVPVLVDLGMREK